MAIAVFPVWRSPMISSRCPRPMGIMASIALIPVCRGWFTGCRKITPGALRSSGISYRSPVILPFPSMGSPRVLITRPRSPSPALMEAIFRVRFTVSPSFSLYDSPSKTAPTLSSSRLSTMALIPFFSNSIISPDSALLSP